MQGQVKDQAGVHRGQDEVTDTYLKLHGKESMRAVAETGRLTCEVKCRVAMHLVNISPI